MYSLQYCRDCRVHIVRGASHWVQQDQPELVNALMRQFMEEDFMKTFETIPGLKSNL